MGPEISNAKTVVHSALFLPLTFRADELLEVSLQMIPQYLNIRMHLGSPFSVYIIHIRNMNFLATETGNYLCTVVPKLWRNTVGRGGNELPTVSGALGGVQRT
jgi:hypothetical protein